MKKTYFLTSVFLAAGLFQLFFNSNGLMPSRIVSAATRSTKKEFRIVGYTQHYNLAKLSPELDSSKLTHINIAFLHPDSSGQIMMADSNTPIDENKLNSIKQFIGKMRGRGVNVLLSLGGGAVSEPKTGSKAEAVKENYIKLLADKKLRKKFVASLVDYLKKMNFDGVDIDFEGPFLTELNKPKNNLFSSFIKELRKKLPRGKLLTTALKKGYGGASVPRETLRKFDWINVMAYDNTGNWEDSEVGQHSSIEDAGTELEYWRQQVGKERIVLGVPFYGVGFNELKRPFHYSYNEIITKFSGNSAEDTAGNIIYYNGVTTIKEKVRIAGEKASGIMIWELSQDSEGDTSLLSAIRDKSRELKLR